VGCLEAYQSRINLASGEVILGVDASIEGYGGNLNQGWTEDSKLFVSPVESGLKCLNECGRSI
jgi:hypothetical protein